MMSRKRRRRTRRAKRALTVARRVLARRALPLWPVARRSLMMRLLTRARSWSRVSTPCGPAACASFVCLAAGRSFSLLACVWLPVQACAPTAASRSSCRKGAACGRSRSPSFPIHRRLGSRGGIGGQPLRGPSHRCSFAERHPPGRAAALRGPRHGEWDVPRRRWRGGVHRWPGRAWCLTGSCA